ncbi:MAG: dihydroorotate dehydrogenase electron transfer subunit [Bacteroidetes bacterium]|nr:dihydroorotate dehydrogenase electron transfer subunit [Bacteroidota bacterium]MCL5025455.1 dihydroorotate dehydrogenase electron transfer subunit [Chloroflexota bacterium]
MIRTDALVLSNTAVAGDIFLLRLRAPEIARDAAPGQFVEVRCGSTLAPLLRRPISIHRIGPRAAGYAPDEIALVIRVIGEGSRLLSRLREGDTLDLLGPLGRGFRLFPGTRRVLLVAGGLGLAPLVALADEAIAHEVNVVLLGGAETACRILPPQYLPPEVEYQVCTEDGSLGACGMVTNLCPPYLEWADQVFVCGPEAMLPPVVDQLRALAQGGRRLPVQVSLEARMACGMGVCLSCVVETRHGLKRVCRDGPVFDLTEVRVW